MRLHLLPVAVALTALFSTSTCIQSTQSSRVARAAALVRAICRNDKSAQLFVDEARSLHEQFAADCVTLLSTSSELGDRQEIVLALTVTLDYNDAKPLLVGLSSANRNARQGCARVLAKMAYCASTTETRSLLRAAEPLIGVDSAYDMGTIYIESSLFSAEELQRMIDSNQKGSKLLALELVRRRNIRSLSSFLIASVTSRDRDIRLAAARAAKAPIDAELRKAIRSAQRSERDPLIRKYMEKAVGDSK